MCRRGEIWSPETSGADRGTPDAPRQRPCACPRPGRYRAHERPCGGTGGRNGQRFDLLLLRIDGRAAGSTANALADRGIASFREGLGGEFAHLEWPTRLSTVLRAEAHGEDGHAVMELFVGARTSSALAG